MGKIILSVSSEMWDFLYPTLSKGCWRKSCKLFTKCASTLNCPRTTYYWHNGFLKVLRKTLRFIFLWVPENWKLSSPPSWSSKTETVYRSHYHCTGLGCFYSYFGKSLLPNTRLLNINVAHIAFRWYL